MMNQIATPVSPPNTMVRSRKNLVCFLTKTMIDTTIISREQGAQNNILEPSLFPGHRGYQRCQHLQQIRLL